MAEADKSPQEVFEPSVLTEKPEVKSGVFTPEPSSAGVKEEPMENQLQEEKVELITPQRIINLQRDLTALVTNIQTAADAKESMRRTELEEARRLRLERLENDVKTSQEKFEEITRGWSIAKEKVIHQELQEALNNQQQLCAALIEDKKKLINDLQQELKAGDDRFVKDLRKQAEELDLMMERMEDQIKTLTKAYREELTQMERVYQQETEVLLTTDKTEWEQHMKELLDKELERLAHRKKKVEEYEAKIHNVMLECNITEIEDNGKFQELGRKQQQIKANKMIRKLSEIKPRYQMLSSHFNLEPMKNRMVSLQKDIENLKARYANQAKQFTKKSKYLSKEHERNIQQYQRLQKTFKHRTAADVRKFEKMWLMIEAEVKQLVEKALVIDSLICKQHLGLAWEQPSMAFMEVSGPIQPKKQAWKPTVSQSFKRGQALQCSQRMVDASVGPGLETKTERTGMEGTAVQSDSDAEVEEGTLSMETAKGVMELLCDETGFLMEDKVLNLLTPLEKEEQTLVKLGSLLCSVGIKEEDVPKLAHFLIKYKHQHREETEDDCIESGGCSDKAREEETSTMNHLTFELVDPNHVVPALKSFLKQLTRSRQSSSHQHPSFQRVQARDNSEDEAYWESMGNVISEDKVKLWTAAEHKMKQYHAVLTEVSELILETQSLEQQNTELRMLLQQSLSSTVGTELKMP